MGEILLSTLQPSRPPFSLNRVAFASPDAGPCVHCAAPLTTAEVVGAEEVGPAPARPWRKRIWWGPSRASGKAKSMPSRRYPSPGEPEERVAAPFPPRRRDAPETRVRVIEPNDALDIIRLSYRAYG